MISDLEKMTKSDLLKKIAELEKKLVQSKNRHSVLASDFSFESTFYLNPSAIGISTLKEGKIVETNEAFCKIIGYKRKEVIGKRSVDLKFYADPKVREEYVKEIKKHGRLENQEVEIIKKSGQKSWFLMSFIVFTQNNQKYLLTTAADITKQKEIELRIMEKEFAISSALSAIALADIHGNLTYVNSSFLRMWGYKNESDVIGKEAVSFWQNKNEAQSVIKGIMKDGQWTGEMLGIKKDNTLMNVQLSASIVLGRDKNPIAMMASFIDITDTKKLKGN